MTEAVAGESAGALSNFADYGLAGLVIGVLLFIFYKFGQRWIDMQSKRDEWDRESRKEMHESINRLVVATELNSSLAERHTTALMALSVSVGRLPCTERKALPRSREYDMVEMDMRHQDG